MIKWLPAAGYIATSRPWSGGGRLRGLLGRSKLILSLSSLMGASVCSQTGLGAGPASPQCLPMTRSGPCTSLGVRVGLVDFARPRVSRCRGCASLPEFYFPPRSPRIRIMRRQTSYETAIWLLFKLGLCATRARNRGVCKVALYSSWQIRNKRCATASFASRCRVELSQRQLCLIPAHRASSS